MAFVYISSPRLIERLDTVFAEAKLHTESPENIAKEPLYAGFSQYRCVDPVARVIRSGQERVLVLADRASMAWSKGLVGRPGTYTFLLAGCNPDGTRCRSLRGTVERVLMAAGMLGIPQSFRYLFTLNRELVSAWRGDLAAFGCDINAQEMCERETRAVVRRGSANAAVFAGPGVGVHESTNEGICYLAVTLPFSTAFRPGTGALIRGLSEAARTAGAIEIRPAQNWRFRVGLYDSLVGHRMGEAEMGQGPNSGG